MPQVRNRWVVLSVFTLVAGLSQMLWLNFAPLISLIQTRYGVSELTASHLITVFPLLYVVLSLPAGSMTDRRGYRFTVGVGAVLTAIFAWVRALDDSFAFMMVGQIGIAIGQPFVLNGISKLVGDWFDKEQSAIATGIGTMGLFLGMALGLAITPWAVEEVGLMSTMAWFAAVTTVGCAAFLVFCKERQDPASQAPIEVRSTRVYLTLLKNRNLSLLFVLALLGLGFFNGLTTWLEGILAPNGVDAIHAGLVGAALIAGGIFGAIAIPALSDKMRRRKPFLLGCVAIALAAIYPLCTSENFGLLIGLAIVMGFFFLPAYALLLEMTSEVAGPALAGTATGILMLAGNLGGVIVIVAMEAIKGDAPTFHSAVLFLMGVLACAIALSALLEETFAAKVMHES